MKFWPAQVQTRVGLAQPVRLKLGFTLTQQTKRNSAGKLTTEIF